MAEFVVSEAVKQNIAAYREMRLIREKLREAEVPSAPGKGPEHWTTRAVAERMGVTKDQYERLERPSESVANLGDAKKSVSVDDLVAAAFALEVSPAELLLPPTVLDSEPELTIAVRESNGTASARFTLTVIQYALWVVGFVRFPHGQSQRWERGLIRRRPTAPERRPDDRRSRTPLKLAREIRRRLNKTNPFSSVAGAKTVPTDDAHLVPYRYSEQQLSVAPSTHAIVTGSDLITEALNLLDLLLTEPGHADAPDRWSALSRLLDELAKGVQAGDDFGHP